MRTTVNSRPAIYENGDTRYPWVDINGDHTGWTLVECGTDGVTVNGITFTCRKTNLLGAETAGASIPALGDIGLAIMIAFIEALGGFVFSRTKGMTQTTA